MNQFSGWNWRLGGSIAGIALLLFISGELGFDLLFGWMGFLVLVIPQVSIRWDGLAIFAIATGIFTIVTHLFLRWFFRELAIRSEQPILSWRWRSTFALVGITLIMFSAGIAMIGVTHQTAWLCTSPEPIFGEEPQISNHASNTTTLQLKDLGLAVNWHQQSFKHLPTQTANGPYSTTGHRQSWVTKILWYLPLTLPEEYDIHQAWNSPVNAKHFKRFVPHVLNPELRTPPLRDANGFALNHYAGNSHIFDEPPRSLTDFSNSELSSILMIGEVNANFIPWGQPENSRDPLVGVNSPHGFGGPSHAKATKFVMLDGSVRSISHHIDPEVLKEMSIPK